jgi:hypothetical protein
MLISCNLARPLLYLFSSLASTCIPSLLLTAFALVVSFFQGIYYSFSLTLLLLVYTSVEKLVELLLISVSTLGLNFLLELINLIHVLSLLLVLFSLFVSLDCLVELLVLKSLLPLLEVLYLNLLLQ